MKTFINVARMLVFAMLFFSLSVVADCCNNRCAVKQCATNGCKLPIQPVTIKKTCDHPGYVKQVCHLEYEPCQGKVEEVTAMPIYKGCYDAQGNQINGSGAASYGYSNGNRQVVTPDIQVNSSAYGYSNGRNKRISKRANINNLDVAD